MPVFRSNVVLTNGVMGGQGINSWHVAVTDLGTGVAGQLGGATEALRVFYTALQADFAAGTTVGHDGDWVRAEDGEDGYETVDPWTFQSSAPSGAMPPHIAVVAGWGTESRRRSGYGRTFIGPLTKGSNQDDGTPSPGLITRIRDAQDVLLGTSGGTNGWAFQVFSRKQQQGRDFTSRTVHDSFAVLRSRRP